MIKTNLKLAIRNIFRNKLYSAINIIGLSVASAFCILVYMYVKNERSFDNFHKDSDRLYRVEETDFFASFRRDQKDSKSFFSFLMKDEEQKNMLTTPMILAGDLKTNFPEVENAVRIKEMYDPIVRIGNQSFKEKEENAAYVDQDFFKAFTYPLLEGNPSSVLAEHNNVVISERLAKKYFGTTNAVGKTLNLTTEKLLLVVSGVVKDFPLNSSFRFDMLVPRASDPGYAGEMKNGVNAFSDLLVIKLKQGTDVPTFQKKIDEFTKTYFKILTDEMAKDNPKTRPAPFHVYLRPYAEGHYNQSLDWGHYTDLKNIYQLVCLAFIILLIACVNYILLTLTSAMSRSQDVGVRKTIGASRKQIILQYYVETQVLAFISVIVGFIVAVTFLPFFNSLTGSDIRLSFFPFGTLAVGLLLLGVILGLLAGIYPALAMSGLKPLNIMRSFSAYRLNPIMSKGLVVVQFGICVLLIISALVVNKQMHYINQTSMGFDTDQITLIRNPFDWEDQQSALLLKERLRQYVASQPYLQGMTTTSFSFGGYNTSGHLINGKRVMLQELNVDYDYLLFNKIPILLGRDFSRDIASDTAKLTITADQKIAKNSTVGRNIIVNETLYKLLGKPKLDVVNREMGGVIIGVSKDYHTDDLTKKIEPSYHIVNAHYTGYYWVKIGAGHNIPQAMENLHAFWNKNTGNLPFSFTFMDQDVAKSYDAYLRWMATITTACVLAIIIACMGLFGLSGLTTINRTKEIGIRKVLGASISNLFLLLNRGTLIMAAGSFIIAAPIAYYLVHQWLDNFAYRITPDWLLFGSAGLIAMLTAIIAVSYHTVRAAIANPVKSLRSE